MARMSQYGYDPDQAGAFALQPGMNGQPSGIAAANGPGQPPMGAFAPPVGGSNQPQTAAGLAPPLPPPKGPDGASGMPSPMQHYGYPSGTVPTPPPGQPPQQNQFWNAAGAMAKPLGAFGQSLQKMGQQGAQTHHPQMQFPQLPQGGGAHPMPQFFGQRQNGPALQTGMPMPWAQQPR